MLNAYATMLAQGNISSDDLISTFASFIIKVEKSWPELPNKEPNCPLGIAYYTFWGKFNERT